MIESEEQHHLKREIDNFKIKVVEFFINFGRNSIIRNEHIRVQKRGLRLSEVFALLNWSSAYHIVKINIIYVWNIVKISGRSVKSANNIGLLTIIKSLSWQNKN